jgi:hypothetical protein
LGGMGSHDGRDGWPSRKVWVAKLVRDGLLNWQHSEFKSRHPSTIINGLHKRKKVASQIIYKKLIEIFMHPVKYFIAKKCNSCLAWAELAAHGHHNSSEQGGEDCADNPHL